ncbi:calcium-transporting ATPase 9, plasma membrane-type-like [Olea europaea var. sylvestris]|uniref:calcium-transporting ATPase 9, plasma membrane-type-like n=1 Tax=Olea europaea var. sylvestris TaxID=158386 RepID=UPI000C1D7FBF|nr:calcium-transporting ATPase 9, plasma membrane-type-like [Olea europaea var. sylvestris]
MKTGNDSPPPTAAEPQHDLEAGIIDIDASSASAKGLAADEEEFSDPFDIGNTKNASHESLKRWRQAALVLNASRRFRYTLDLKKDDEQEQRRSMIRAHAQVIRAALLFKLAGQRAIVLGTAVSPPTPNGDYGIGHEELASMSRDHNSSALQQYGGVKGLSKMLKTNIETGIAGDDELPERQSAFGSNTYPTKKGRSFLRFLWEAWQDLTLIILIIAAAASLALGIKAEGLDEGWYDGGSITFAVLLVIFVTGKGINICCYHFLSTFLF